MTCLHNIIWGYKKHFLGRNIKKSAASHMQRYAFLLKDARNYWKIFEAEEDKKKKVCPACPIYGARRIHHFILWVRKILIDTSRKKITLDAIWIADTYLNMILFSESCIRI